MTAVKAERRKRRSADEVRGLILSAAERLFEAHGFAGTTTAMIAATAQTTEAQLFRMFPTKADLFRQAVHESLNSHFDGFMAGQLRPSETAQPHAEKAQDYIAALQDFLGDHAKMLLTLLSARRYDSDTAKAMDPLDGMQDYFARGAALMKERTGKDAPIAPELMVRVSFAALLGNVLARDMLFPSGTADDAAIDAAIADFMMRGLAANEGAAQ